MLGRMFRTADPFEGAAAQRRHLRLRVEGAVAFAMAVAACGLTAAVWLQLLAPVLAQRLSLG